MDSAYEIFYLQNSVCAKILTEQYVNNKQYTNSYSNSHTTLIWALNVISFALQGRIQDFC